VKITASRRLKHTKKATRKHARQVRRKTRKTKRKTPPRSFKQKTKTVHGRMRSEVNRMNKIVGNLTLRRLLPLALVLVALIGVTAVTGALIYSYNLKSKVNPQEAPVIFTAGTDNVATVNPQGTKVSINVGVVAEVTTTYSDVLHIKSQDGKSHQIQLSVTSTTGNTSIVQSLEFILTKPDGATIQVAKITSGTLAQNGSGWQTLPANEEWTVKIVTVGVAGAALNQNIGLELEMLVT